MATQSELAQIQHILGKRRSADHNPLDLSARKKSREYLDSHKDVEKRRRDRINTCLETIRTLVPLCSQLPRHRRVDKADLLDLAIIYLRMVNKFLEKIGITDIFSAAHQQVNLFTSLEKWLRHQGENHTDVPTFTKEILGVLEREMETASHVIASQQTTGKGAACSEAALSPQDGVEWMKHEQGTMDDEQGIPRSYQPLSGSDEESLVSGNSDIEGRRSGSDDSIPSPNYLSSKHADFMRKCHLSCSREESSGVYQNGLNGSCSCPSMGLTTSNGYHIPYRDSCGAPPKPQCADKAVNTDRSSMAYCWPLDSTITLPITSGKIVLHTPPGDNGSSNLNTPVTLHAEIHPLPHAIPQQPCKQPTGPQKDDGDFENEVMSVGSAKCKKCTDPPRSEDRNYPTSRISCEIGTHSSGQFQLGSPLPRGAVSMNTPPPAMHVERNGGQGVVSKGNAENVPQAQRSYASLTKGHYLEERDLICLDGDRRDPPDSSEVCCNGQREAPLFSKRFLTSLGHQQAENNLNNNNSNRGHFSDRFPTTSSSLKLKSLMVHRHQSQHV